MTITFALVLGHRAWSVEITFEVRTWDARILKEEEARLDNYTIEDLYRDSPTDTPFAKMVEDVTTVMDDIAHDPLNDPELVKASDLLREMWKMRTGPWLKQLDEDQP